MDQTSAGFLVTEAYGPGTTADFTNNTIIDNTTGIAVGYDESDASTVTAHNNLITGNTSYGISSTNPSVDATCNWWGTAVASEIDALIDGDVTWTPYLQTADGPCGGIQPVHNVTQSIYYTTIQGAIDDATAGDVIEVAAGNYVEEITIDKALTLRGLPGM
ncbi:MAG: hypothetical protein U5Q03_11865 [Bacteroidota bacterium]|nr:hypothetical protein [Bacteroidota bacterium]